MKKFIFLFIIFIFVLLLLSFYVTPYTLKTNNYYIKNENIINGIKIAHFSDTLIENEDDLEMLEKTISNINSNKPNIIIFTGNLVKKNINDSLKEKIINLLDKFTLVDYKFYVLGDHDTDTTKDIFAKCNFVNLNTESKLLFDDMSLPILFTTLDENHDLLINTNESEYSFAIALIHEPDYFNNIENDKYTYVFAGNSLGGEIRLPFYGALIRNKNAKIYTNEYYKKDNSEMYVSFGIGLGKTKMRLFNKPSINIYNFIAN